MTYDSMANLKEDTAFRDRVYVCCMEQALVFQNDGRYSIAALARQIIMAPNYAEGVFQLVVVSPNFKNVMDSTTVPDIEILAAVQQCWPTYAELMFPAPPEVVPA
jgi:hypothetical protein